MNLKERDRLGMLSRVRDGQMTITEASRRLGLSYRQGKRLWRRYRAEGDAGLAHRLRGRPGNNRRSTDARRGQALDLYRQRYADFGPTLAAEVMAERDDLTVDHETLRRWLIDEGLWRARRSERRRHPRRPRKECFGELVQLDGSDHRWFGSEHERCTLMVMVDDATNQTWARFFDAETTESAMTIFRGWVREYGLPGALYPDRHSIHRRNDKEADEIAHRTGNRPLTQFGRAMEQLGVKLICAHSPQAKGRVERTNGVLQDRLVKMLKLQGITDMAAANAYLRKTFLPAHNARFAVTATREHDAHRPAPPAEELDAALSLHHRRKVSADGVVSWQGRCMRLSRGDALPRRGMSVTVREHLDGRIELLAADGRLLNYQLPDERTIKPRPTPTLAERLAQYAPPHKPPATHAWRRPFAGTGSATAAGCALASAAPVPANHNTGHFY